MSGLADLVRELQLLREEVAGLASRVGALENRPESRSLASGSPVTLNYTFAGASSTPYPEVPPFPVFSPGHRLVVGLWIIQRLRGVQWLHPLDSSLPVALPGNPEVPVVATVVASTRQ